MSMSMAEAKEWLASMGWVSQDLWGQEIPLAERRVRMTEPGSRSVPFGDYVHQKWTCIGDAIYPVPGWIVWGIDNRSRSEFKPYKKRGPSPCWESKAMDSGWTEYPVDTSTGYCLGSWIKDGVTIIQYREREFVVHLPINFKDSTMRVAHAFETLEAAKAYADLVR